MRPKRIPALIGVFVLSLALAPSAAASGHCTTVDTSRGPLTAKEVNPGELTQDTDAEGCDIAVYFDEDGSVDGADIDAGSIQTEHFSVFVDGAAVDITDSTFGEAFVHVLYADGATGTINGNTIDGHERVGLVVSGADTRARVTDNTVTGSGPKSEGWAENGIQVSYGATGKVSDNTVTGHWWDQGDWASAGILVFESDDVNVHRNTLAANQVGVGVESWCWVQPSADGNHIARNTISESQVGVSVRAIALDGASACDPRAANNRVVNNAMSDSDDHAIIVGTSDFSDDYEPSVSNTKVINNRTEADILFDDDSGKQHANFSPSG